MYLIWARRGEGVCVRSGDASAEDAGCGETFLFLPGLVYSPFIFSGTAPRGFGSLRTALPAGGRLRHTNRRSQEDENLPPYHKQNVLCVIMTWRIFTGRAGPALAHECTSPVPQSVGQC